MNYLSIAACCILLSSGCVSRSKSESRLLDDYQSRLAAVASFGVPLPEATPYDTDPEAKRAYINSFEQGYKSGLTGYNTSHCLVDVPYRDAHIRGWYSGQSEGWKLWAEDNFKMK